MKFYERKDFFQYSWNQVASAFWFRYPNPYSKHVQTEDILARKVENGLLYTKRLLTKTVRLTYFGYNITLKNEPIIEESFIDPTNQVIKTCTFNIGTSSGMIKEVCYYKETKEKQTVIEREAWIASSKLYFSRAIESYMFRRFRKNISKTCDGLQYVLENMFPSASPLENKTLGFKDSKLCETAKKAKELAKSRTVPIFASCTPNNQ